MENVEPIEVVPKGHPAESEIRALKAKHGNDLYLIDVPVDPPAVFVFKKADRKTISASAKAAQTDPLLGGEVLLKNTLVWGDAKRLDDTSVFLSVSERLDQLNTPPVATLKNL